MSKTTDTDNAPKTLEEQLSSKLQEVKIIRYSSPDIEDDIYKYQDAKKSGAVPENTTLNDYIKETRYKDQPNVVVITDLTNHNFNTVPDPSLKGVDFSGCIMKGVQFYSCDLSGAQFRDTDLRGVIFDDTILKNVDFRGADLTNCRFAESYQKWIDPLKPGAKLPEGFDPKAPTPEDLRNPEADNLKGLKFSTTQRREREHLYQNQVKDEAIGVERQAFTTQKDIDVKAKEAEISKERGYSGMFYDSAPVKVLLGELEEINKRSFNKKPDYAIDPTVLNVMSFDRVLDPAYVRGSTAADLTVERQYIPMSKEDVVKYLERVKTEPKLSINDFAKEQALAGELENQKKFASLKIEVEPKAQAVADCSDVDLKGLDFSGTNMKGACFAGAKLEGCKFDRADISRATFEGATVQGASFVDTDARQANFFTSDLKEAQITGSDFGRAFMSLSVAEGAEIKTANFDYANIKNGKWDGVGIEGSSFNGSNLEGVSLIGASIKTTSMQHAILKDAHMERAQVEASNFSRSMMQGLQAQNAEFKDTVLNEINAREANLTGATLDSLCTLDDAQLQKAVLDLVKAQSVSFKNAKLDEARAKQADFTGANLEKASMQFANLEGAILKSAKANNVDMIGCSLKKVDAREAIFTDAILKDMQAQQANLEQAIIDGADARGARLQGAILERVSARKAQLQQIETDKNTIATGMNVEGATVDLGTEELSGAKGTVTREEVDGTKVEMPIEQHNEQAVNIKKEKQATTVGKMFAGACSYIGGGVKKIGAIIKQPFSSKTGAIVGVVLGLVVAAAIITSVVMTAGLSIPVMVGVAAAVAGGCALVGAAAGYFGAKHVGGLSVAAAAVAIPTGPTGMAIAAGVAVGVDKAVEAGTGKTASAWVGDGTKAVGEKIEEVGKAYEGGGKVAEQQVEQQKDQKLQYEAQKQKEQEKSKYQKPIKSVEQLGMENNLAAKQSLDKPPVIGKGPKEIVVEPKAPVKEKGSEKGIIDKIKGKFTRKVIDDKGKGPSKDKGPQVSG